MNRTLSTLAFAAVLSCALVNAGTNAAYADDNYPTTLDNLYASGSSTIQSAYILTPTGLTEGDGVYKIGEKYYQLAIKEGVTYIPGTQYPIDGNITGHFINLTSNNSTNIISNNAGLNAFQSMMNNLGYTYSDTIDAAVQFLNAVYDFNVYSSVYDALSGYVQSLGYENVDDWARIQSDGEYWDYYSYIEYGDGVALDSEARDAGYWDYDSAVQKFSSDNNVSSLVEYAQKQGYTHSPAIKNINSDFIKNSIITDGATWQNHGGGIIRNYVKSDHYEVAAIGNIKGDFIGNTLVSNEYWGDGAEGAAIYNAAYTWSEVDHTRATAIIDNIVGNFIGNSVISTEGWNSRALGGAIANKIDSWYGTAIINNITGNFISNSVICTRDSSDLYYDNGGGAIANATSGWGGDVIIGNITGNFLYNTSSTSGGAIFNCAKTYSGSATIGNIIGDFIGNSAYLGGAIANAYGTINNISGNFVGNHAVSHGGAILNDAANMTLLADGSDYVISGNWIGEESNVRNEAIYLSGYDGTFTINAINNGSWTIDDYINSGSNYNYDEESYYHHNKLIFTGDETGKITYKNVILGYPDFTVENVTAIFDLADGEAKTSYLNTMNIENSTFSIDLDTDNMAADNFVVHDEANGTVLINKLNVIGSGDEGIFQILNIGGGDAQLAFAPNIKFIYNGEEQQLPGAGVYFGPQMVDNTVAFGDIYASEEGLGTTTINTINDSIYICKDALYDQTLTYLSQKQTEEERNFNFLTSGDVYKVEEALGLTAPGTLNINGVTDSNGELSTIDFNGTRGFYLDNGTGLNISNVKLTNATNSAISLTTANAIANLNNVNFTDNNTSNFGGAIYNNNGTIGDITGDFIGNSATSRYMSAVGQMLQRYNATDAEDFARKQGYHTLEGMLGDYGYSSLEDMADDWGYDDSYTQAQAGAIYNTGTIGIINSNFISNAAISDKDKATIEGGAIYNLAQTPTERLLAGATVSQYVKNNGYSIGYHSQDAAVQAYLTNNGFSDKDIWVATRGGRYATYDDYLLDDNIALEEFASWEGYDDVDEYLNDYYGGISKDEWAHRYTGEHGVPYSNYAEYIADSNTSIEQYARWEGYEAVYTSQEEAVNAFMVSKGCTTENELANYYGYDSMEYLLSDYGYSNIAQFAKDEGFRVGYTSQEEAVSAFLADRNCSTPEELAQKWGYDSVQEMLDNDGCESIEEMAHGYGYKSVYFSEEEALAAFLADNNATTLEEAAIARGYNATGIKSITNSIITGNYAKSAEGEAQGGAIWTRGDLTLVADDGVTLIKDNYTESAGERDDNAIYVANDAKLTLKQVNNGRMSLYDNVRGSDDYKVDITGDGTGTMYLYNDLYGANVTMGNTNLNTINNVIHTYNFKSLTLTDNINMFVDMDLANETMDRLTADTYGAHTGTLTVSGINLISDTTKDKLSILFADEGLARSVRSSVNELPMSGYQTELYTPIYKYNLAYNVHDDNKGYFDIVRPSSGGGGDNPTPEPQPEDFNPAVLASPVATQAAGQVTMNQTFQYVFEHSDMFMQMPSSERLSQIHGNEYAISTDYNNNLGQLDLGFENKGIWVKPYTSFDTTNLKNGPRVHSISYGTLVGGDSNFRKLKHGWTNVGTAYVGYFGSQLDYSHVSTSLNGGLLGLTETFYKGNFFTALTATVGGGAAENHTMYGKEDLAMMMAGIASKTGYNFEFNEGKFIMQPLLMLNYSMVKTFDYTNAAGVKINSDPMHTIQINPTIRFIGNLKNGWQPYASVGMVWNLMNETNVTANGVDLPNMHTRPYVEYGVGLQKTWKDRFSGFGQVMMRNGGRNGVALTAGFRWSIGKDNKKIEKVQKDNNKNIVKVKQNKKASATGEKHELKSLTQDQLADR